MRITVLNENTVYGRGLLAEHGLSLLLEEGGRRVLFDTGQSDVYLHNAKELGVGLEGLDAVVLSHGHYDHTGGLLSLSEETAPVYAGEGAFAGKLYRNREGGMDEIGIPWGKERLREGRLQLVREKTQILPGWFLLPNVPYRTEFEEKNDCFFLAESGGQISCRRDLLADEQILVLRTGEGLCLFMGCCHAGIINCILHVQDQFPGEHIHLILAGMHLSAAKEERIQKTIEAFQKLEFDCLLPVHCTGLLSIARLKLALGERCRIVFCGSSLQV